MSPPNFPLARALCGAKTRIEETLCVLGDGTEAWVSLLGAPIAREDGSVEGAVVVVQDIDQIKRERLLSLAEFSSKNSKAKPLLRTRNRYSVDRSKERFIGSFLVSKLA
jgi:hypothetical protein